MEYKSLSEYEQVLYGCRFCPMCKPASEVGSLTQRESHSTRGRALMLWRVAKDLAQFSLRDAELLYQSTLDSVSQAWCINHYPVAEYVAAARRELVSKDLVPAAVKKILQLQIAPEPCPQAETVLLAGELSELEEADAPVAADPAVKLLEKCGQKAAVFLAPTGALAYALGDIRTAREQATGVAEAVKTSGVKRIIADGPQTLYALKALYPLLGIELPAATVVESLNQAVESALDRTKIALNLDTGEKVFFHDHRSASVLAEELARDEAIQPENCGTEEYSGSGEVYQRPRRILEKLGYPLISSVWSRSLSKSTGTDDGLWHTYPDLAAGLARMRLEHIESLGAAAVVTDSILDALHLRRVGKTGSGQLKVFWFPELFAC